MCGTPYDCSFIELVALAKCRPRLRNTRRLGMYEQLLKYGSDPTFCSLAKQYNEAGDFTFGSTAVKKRKRDADTGESEPESTGIV